MAQARGILGETLMTDSGVLHSGLFETAAKIAFGEHWVTPVAQALGVNDRTIRRIGESVRAREENPAAIALLFPLLECMRARRTELSLAIELVEANAKARVMRDDCFAVLRWIATDDLGPLHGYDGSLNSCVRAGWAIGGPSNAVLTGAGLAAYRTELDQRQSQGLPVDIDPLRIA
jgi:hypothetical protein